MVTWIVRNNHPSSLVPVHWVWDTEPLWVLHFSQYATHPVTPLPSHTPFLQPVKPPLRLPITSQLPPPHPLSLHLPLWTAGSQCVILFIPCFLPPLLSPLHPSIPFFHVCSAVKPGSIRPASLITRALCCLWNQVGQKQSWLQQPYLYLHCMELRSNLIHLHKCKIYQLKAQVHTWFQRYLAVWNTYKKHQVGFNPLVLSLYIYRKSVC